MKNLELYNFKRLKAAVEQLKLIKKQTRHNNRDTQIIEDCISDLEWILGINKERGCLKL